MHSEPDSTRLKVLVSIFILVLLIILLLLLWWLTARGSDATGGRADTTVFVTARVHGGPVEADQRALGRFEVDRAPRREPYSSRQVTDASIAP
jgi:hypothetical protein